MMALMPRRISRRPANISIPSHEIAITAMVVAIVPSKVPCSQDTAATKALDPFGSDKEAKLIGVLLFNADTVIKGWHEKLLRPRFAAGGTMS
jgi:hypothetical protein